MKRKKTLPSGEETQEGSFLTGLPGRRMGAGSRAKLSETTERSGHHPSQNGGRQGGARRPAPSYGTNLQDAPRFSKASATFRVKAKGCITRLLNIDFKLTANL